MTLGRPQLAAADAPIFPLTRQLVAAMDAQQPIDRPHRGWHAGRAPSYVSALGDVKKLRTTGPRHACAQIHVAQPLALLDTAFALMQQLPGVALELFYLIRCILCKISAYYTDCYLYTLHTPKYGPYQLFFPFTQLTPDAHQHTCTQ